MNKIKQINFKKKIYFFLKKNLGSNQDICLHLDLFNLNNLFRFKSEKELYKFIYNIFKKKNRSILIPSYSFSWGREKKKKIYILKKSKSKLGFLPEYVRKNNLGSRTMDPMFSFYVIGKKKRYLNFENNTFGKGSIFEEMYKNNCKIIMFDTFQFAPTFIHYIEQYFHEKFQKLTYRYLKKFFGYFGSEKKNQKLQIVVFSRVLAKKKIYDDTKIVFHLKKSNKFKKININGINIIMVNSKDLFNTGIKGLKENKNFFYKNVG